MWNNGDVPKALDVDWAAIERACTAGMSFQEAERVFGIPSDTIYKRSVRKAWIVPTKIEKIVREVSEREKTMQIVGNTVGQTWAERGEAHRRMVFEKAYGGLTSAQLPTPKSWKDAEIADKMARRAAGLDNAETQVNNMFHIGAPIAEDPAFGNVIDVESANPLPIEDGSTE